MSPSILIVWYFTAKPWGGIGPLAGIIIGALVGFIGSLVCVSVGARLTRSGQRRQWVQDNKRAEYRELINGLRVCAYDMRRKSRANDTEIGRLNSGDELLDVDGPETRGYNMVSDRFFIDDAMDREKVRERWRAVFKQQSDQSKFWPEWSALYNVLMKTARSDLKDNKW
jgi:hypothetical protein